MAKPKEKPLPSKAAVRKEIATHDFSGNTVVAWDSGKHKVPQLGAVGRALQDAIKEGE